MRRFTLLAAVTAAVALPLLTAAPASAEEPCYTAHVKGFDTFAVCLPLPIPELEP